MDTVNNAQPESSSQQRLPEGLPPVNNLNMARPPRRAAAIEANTTFVDFFRTARTGVRRTKQKKRGLDVSGAEAEILMEYGNLVQGKWNPAWSTKAFSRVVREIEHHDVVHRFDSKEWREVFEDTIPKNWTAKALQELQIAADGYVVNILASAWQFAKYGSRVTLMGQDIRMAEAANRQNIIGPDPKTQDDIFKIIPLADSRRKSERERVKAGEIPGVDFIADPAPSRKEVQEELKKKPAALDKTKAATGCLRCQGGSKYGPGSTWKRKLPNQPADTPKQPQKAIKTRVTKPKVAQPKVTQPKVTKPKVRSRTVATRSSKRLQNLPAV